MPNDERVGTAQGTARVAKRALPPGASSTALARRRRKLVDQPQITSFFVAKPVVKCDSAIDNSDPKPASDEDSNAAPSDIGTGVSNSEELSKPKARQLTSKVAESNICPGVSKSAEPTKTISQESPHSNPTQPVTESNRVIKQLPTPPIPPKYTAVWGPHDDVPGRPTDNKWVDFTIPWTASPYYGQTLSHVYKSDPGYIRQLKAQGYREIYPEFRNALWKFEVAHFNESHKTYRFTFGQFCGKAFREVPFDYLVWLKEMKELDLHPCLKQVYGQAMPEMERLERERLEKEKIEAAKPHPPPKVRTSIAFDFRPKKKKEAPVVEPRPKVPPRDWTFPPGTKHDGKRVTEVPDGYVGRLMGMSINKTLTDKYEGFVESCFSYPYLAAKYEDMREIRDKIDDEEAGWWEVDCFGNREPSRRRRSESNVWGRTVDWKFDKNRYDF